MKLDKQQIRTLMQLISSSAEDGEDCDGCFGKISEFVESQLEGRDMCDAMHAIQRHLEQCPCCADEYRALLDAMRALN